MRTILVIAAALGSSALAGCGGGARSDALPVVASTNVYGDIAAQIGGARVKVTSILSDPNADPHLFEPGTRNGLAVARARVAIQNGAGYDDFMLKLEHATPSDRRAVVVAADVLGVHGRGANPHLWYDLPRVPRVAKAIAHALITADPRHAPAYRAGLARFTTSLTPLLRDLTADRTLLKGRPVGYTEPVPGYLLAAAGVRNVSPTGFTRAIEDGTEPPPSAVADMDSLIRRHAIDVLLYNEQAISPMTARVRAEAQRAKIPVVGVSETLPAGSTFQTWQRHQLRELEKALGR